MHRSWWLVVRIWCTRKWTPSVRPEVEKRVWWNILWPRLNFLQCANENVRQLPFQLIQRPVGGWTVRGKFVIGYSFSFQKNWYLLLVDKTGSDEEQEGTPLRQDVVMVSSESSCHRRIFSYCHFIFLFASHHLSFLPAGIHIFSYTSRTVLSILVTPVCIALYNASQSVFRPYIAGARQYHICELGLELRAVLVNSHCRIFRCGDETGHWLAKWCCR